MILNALHLTPLLLWAGNAEKTDCRKQLAQFYPRLPVCEKPMTCSDEFACSFDSVANFCDAYKCSRTCPIGTTFLPYYSPQHNDTQAVESSIQQGYACYPNDQIPEHMFNCYFDQNNDFQLNVDAQVPDITRHFTYDNRNITLISWENYENYSYSDQHAMVNLFESSTCVGVVNGKFEFKLFNLTPFFSPRYR